MPRNNSDLTIFSQMASNGFLTAIILVALFVTLLYRRDSIISVSLFRLGCILYVFSVIGPGMFATAWFWIVGPYSPSQASTPVGYSILLAIIGPVSLGAGLLCIFSSLLPRRPFQEGVAPAPPQKHPLD
jgi:hypothetical protein